MGKYFKIFIYISLIFLVLALIKADYLKLPIIYSKLQLFFSIILLCVGFVLDAVTWKKTLDIMGHPSSLKDCMVSIGLSIFGKYIPGNIWTIAGRASYINKIYNYSNKELLNISAIAQIISIWMGLIFGITGVLLLKEISRLGIIALIVWLAVTLFLISPLPHRIIINLINKIFRKNFKTTFINIKQLVLVIPFYFIRWAIVSIAFYFLINSLYFSNAPLLTVFAYPIAGTLGMIVVFSPGGLGVREGVLIGFLTLSGFTIEAATTISIAGRLWYLIGEFFIFISSLAIVRRSIHHK